MTEKAESIKSVLDAMLKNISMEGMALYAEIYHEPMIVEARKHAQNLDPGSFHFSLCNPIQQMVDAVVEGEFPHNRNAQFLMAHSQFIEGHLDSIFTKFEGSACSHDKTRAVLAHLLMFFLQGKRVEFDYEQQYTFHLPKKVLKDHDSIIAMFEALHHFYYGSPERFLSAYQCLVDGSVDAEEKIL